MRKVMTQGSETVIFDLRLRDLVAVIGRIEKVQEETQQLTVCFSKFAKHPFAAPEDSDTRVEVSEGVILPIGNQSGNDSHFSPENFGKERLVRSIAPAPKHNLKAPEASLTDDDRIKRCKDLIGVWLEYAKRCRESDEPSFAKMTRRERDHEAICHETCARQLAANIGESLIEY